MSPLQPLAHLDDLWFQVTGTLCNLRCRHCFISCSPTNHAFGFLDLPVIERYLEESARLGVKEYYFTGGEPFLHPHMTEILETTLRFGPATVLTNGTVFHDESLRRLRIAEENSLYSLEFRVSLDGATPAENDPVRGHGTFARILAGIGQLLAHDFLPIVVLAQTKDDQDEANVFEQMARLLRGIGYARPRVKILPTLRLGAEVERRRGYLPEERVTEDMMANYDASNLLCHHSRIVTDRGVMVCPILLESPGALLGQSLAEACRPIPLDQPACFTCYQHGAICANASSAPRE
ncbi:MAG: radical SAM protein [Gemmataceae bacterium]